MEKTFHFIQQLLHESAGIPLSKISADRTALLHFLRSSTKYLFDYNSPENQELWEQLLHLPEQKDLMCIWLAPGGITYLIHRMHTEDSFYILGPVLTKAFSQEECFQDLALYAMPEDAREGILVMCSQLPAVEIENLKRIGQLIARHLQSTTAPLQTVSVRLPMPLDGQLSVGADIVYMRQIETRYEYSAALTDAVRQGNLSLALQLIEQYDPSTQTTIRNTNPLRNAQNYCIVLNTQLRHALAESGIHPYDLDKLSNQIGLEIEELKDMKQLYHFFPDILRRYCHLVQEYSYPGVKSLVKLAVVYVKEHLTDTLTVKDTAKALTVNANYLSSLFHEEMGMTFIDFVNKERTQQAAALLKHTNLQIQQIASMVGYNNTSYFAKQFVRFQGVSPSQYRHESK